MVNTDELLQQFGRVYGGVRPTHAVRAPGRVNLIGEHTDYNDGFVLPIAMTQATHVIAGPADDDRVVARSAAFDEPVSFAASDPGPPGEPKWGNYVRGVAAMLAEAGVPIEPSRLLIASDVPIGGGVSSSAALEVGAGLALLALAGRTMDPVELALLARQAEHKYASSPCGIMDQFICALGRADHAMMLDCRSQAVEQVPFALDDSVLMVMDTQVKHSIGGGEYPVRQRQCYEAVEKLQAMDSGIRALRDVGSELLAANRECMSELAFRRATHVVSEVERVLEACEALRRNDLTTFGQLMFASHVSLRDDYEVSCDELDRLVEIAASVPGVYGARMTGGGFGGCAIALLRRDAEQALTEAVRSDYDGCFERPAIVYDTQASPGAGVTEL